MIIGITGTLGAGKGTIVKFLKEKGFVHYSVRDYLAKEIRKLGMSVNRSSMVSVANDLRAKFGSSYIVEELYREANKFKGNCVIESLRCLGEIEALRKKEEFVLWAVDADIEIRYARITDRKSSTDMVSFQDFVKQEEREMHNSDPSKQNLRACIDMAHVCFRNNWTIAELKGKVFRALKQIRKEQRRTNEGLVTVAGSKKKHVRPSWDEYFIGIMKVVADRVTCDRARAGGGGCVIVRDKRILVTGYVGSPPGCAHCDDVGHEFKGRVHEDGRITNHCVRTTHAEQNAICQAAKLGVSIDGATIYCFMFPCYTCAKLIISSGIKRVVALRDYHASGDSKRIFSEAGVDFELLNEEVVKYDKM